MIRNNLPFWLCRREAHSSSQIAGISSEELSTTKKDQKETSGQSKETQHQLLQSWICLHAENRIGFETIQHQILRFRTPMICLQKLDTICQNLSYSQDWHSLIQGFETYLAC